MTFLNRQIVDVCEKCCEWTLYGKNPNSAQIFHTAQTLPSLSGPNQELQLNFAGPILDDKGSKIFLLIAVDRFSKFPSVLITKTTGAKKFTKFLASYIRIHGIPQSIRTDHESGFKNDLVQQFCSSKCIKHSLSPVGDVRGSGFGRAFDTDYKAKTGHCKIDLVFGNFKETIQQIVQGIRKSNHSVLENRLSNYILVVSQILNGLKLIIMLFNLIF